jgi:hypothetical protein
VQIEATTATDGKLTAGAGDVTIDATGILVQEAGNSLSSPSNDYNIGLTTSSPSAQFYCTVSPDNLLASTYIYGRPITVASVEYDSRTLIVSEAPSASSAEIVLRVIAFGDTTEYTFSDGLADFNTSLNVGVGLNVGSASGAGTGQVKVDGGTAGVIIGDRSTSAEWVLYADSGLFRVHLTGTGDRFAVSATGMAFFGASGNTKQTVTGSRGGNAALASLLTALASYGQITDSTTA